MRRNESMSGNGKSKMTVMMFQLEGGDETLREGIRTISQAMGNVLNPTRLLLPKPATNLPTSDAPEPVAVESESETEATAGFTGEDGEPTNRRASKPRSPKILALDLKSAKVGLQEYCDAKGVGDNDTRRYLVTAFWLKENLGIPAVTMDHIHTCYRFLGWQTPTDASSPLRGMKQQGWFDKGTEKGSYTINHVGENEIMRMGNGK